MSAEVFHDMSAEQMTEHAAPPLSPAEGLRLWPGVLVLVVQLAMTKLPLWLGIENPMVLFMGMMFGPIVGAAGIAIWWLFASRVAWSDRFLMLGSWVAGAAIAWLFCHPTMNVRGMGLLVLAMPAVAVMWIGWLIVSMWLPWPVRRWGLVAAILGTWGYYSSVRVDGMTGTFATSLSWRWSETAEQKYLATLSASQPAQSDDKTGSVAPLVLSAEDWPAFRGSNRDSRYLGEPIAANWDERPPRQVWKRGVGPGWSSFAVVGQRLFTQEQRGDDEVVACYDAQTGDEVWAFRDKARFSEVVAGAGPRATPTFHGDKIYAVGALGTVHCLDALTGKPVWSAPMVTDADVKVPEWGYASSPLISGQTVVVLPGRPKGAAVVGFDAQSGSRLWAVGGGEHSYTSAHLAQLAGVEQLLALTSDGLISIDPDSAKILWEHSWPAHEVARCVQPYVEDDTVLISTYFGMGSRKIKVSQQEGQWTTELLWESRDMKPYFNDLVVQDGYAYGFDGAIFCCLDLATGKRAWRGGRYGNGQVLLLARQKQLLLLSEQGEVVLLEANPRELKELHRFQALEGKTWNHPVVAHGRLYVRNGAEMACFDVVRPSK